MSDQARPDGFWLPSMREVWHQVVFYAPGVLVVVQRSHIRIVDKRLRVLLDADLSRVEVHRTFLGTLVLRCRDDGRSVRLLPGATKVGTAAQSEGGRRLMEQVPPELRTARFDDRASRYAYLPAAPSIPGQFGVMRRLEAELVARGATAT